MPTEAISHGLTDMLAPLAADRVAAGIVPTLTLIFSRLTSGPAFEEHAAALEREPQLCDRMLALLLHSVSAAAVAAQLPPDRRPEDFSWDGVAVAARALRSPPMWPAMKCLAASPDGGRRLIRLLTGAAQLVQHAPLPGSLDGDTGCLTPFAINWRFCEVLASTAALFCQQPLQQQLGAEQSRQLAPHLLRALPKLPAALAVGLRDSVPPRHIALFCDSWCGILPLLISMLEQRLPQAGGVPVMRGVEDAAAWCGGTAAAQRSLPLLAQAAQQLSEPGFDPRLVTAPDNAALLICRLAGEAAAAASPAAAGLAGAPSPPDASAVAHAAASMWQLHSAACRLAHWAYTSSGSQQLPSLQHDWPLAMTTTCIMAASHPIWGLCSAQPPSR